MICSICQQDIFTSWMCMWPRKWKVWPRPADRWSKSREWRLETGITNANRPFRLKAWNGVSIVVQPSVFKWDTVDCMFSVVWNTLCRRRVSITGKMRDVWFTPVSKVPHSGHLGCTHWNQKQPSGIMDDIFSQVREGNAFHVRVWLDNTENDLNQGWVTQS